MSDDLKITCNVLYGICNLDSWFEPEILPDGRFTMIGMGSRTDFDKDGKMTECKVEPTGIRLIYPAPETKNWFQRIFL